MQIKTTMRYHLTPVRMTIVKSLQTGTSLVVQCLGLCAPNAGGLGLIPGQGTRSHIPQLKTPRAVMKTPRATTKRRFCMLQ